MDDIDVKNNVGPCFIDNLDDKNIIWKIFSVNGSHRIVKVLNYRVTTDGIPITLTFYDIFTEKTFEIPWHAIMTIEKDDL